MKCYLNCFLFRLFDAEVLYFCASLSIYSVYIIFSSYVKYVRIECLFHVINFAIRAWMLMSVNEANGGIVSIEDDVADISSG